MQNTLAILKAIVARVRRQPSLEQELGDSANLVVEVGLDSLETLQFMLEVEERLGIQIDFDRLEFSYLENLHKLACFLDEMPKRADAIKI